VVTDIVGLGTSETAWRPYLRQLDPPPLDLTHVTGSVVVAPHPDDEILGVGGVIALLEDAEIVGVTDGEASHPDSTVYRRDQMASMRRQEARLALRQLGRPDVPVHRLGQADGAIDEEDVAEALESFLADGRWCFVTWRHDGDPDHEIVGRAAGRACAVTGARLIEYPIWTWHWARPGDERVPWNRARSVELPLPVQRAKAEAIHAFRSQIEPIGPDPEDAPILPAHVVQRFQRPIEVVFV
jgi:LmbE family N-acetylglucosaminyl deacetylase